MNLHLSGLLTMLWFNKKPDKFSNNLTKIKQSLKQTRFTIQTEEEKSILHEQGSDFHEL